MVDLRCSVIVAEQLARIAKHQQIVQMMLFDNVRWRHARLSQNARRFGRTATSIVVAVVVRLIAGVAHVACVEWWPRERTIDAYSAVEAKCCESGQLRKYETQNTITASIRKKLVCY